MVVVSPRALMGCAGAPLLVAFALLQSSERVNAALNSMQTMQGGNFGGKASDSTDALSQQALGSGNYGPQTQMPVPIPDTLPALGTTLPGPGASPMGFSMTEPPLPPLGVMPPPGAMLPPVGAAGLVDPRFSTTLSGLSGTQGPAFGLGNLKSRSALAAGVPVYTSEGGDVLTGEPVADTRTPVGFYASVNGTYITPRFPSTLQKMMEITEEMINRCMLRIPASRMTSGFSDTLKKGGVQIWGNVYQQLLRVVATTSPRYTSKLTVPLVLYKRATGTRITYDMNVAVPSGCALLLNDPSLMALVRREGDYIVEAVVRLHPDVYASYLPSAVALPADLITFATNMAPNSNFQQVGHCVFIAHFTTAPENVVLFASHTMVRVEVQSERPELLELEIPVGCLPQSLHRVALWTTPVTSGTAVIAAFSPPPVDDSEYFIIRSTSNKAAFDAPMARE